MKESAIFDILDYRSTSMTIFIYNSEEHYFVRDKGWHLYEGQRIAFRACDTFLQGRIREIKEDRSLVVEDVDLYDLVER